MSGGFPTGIYIGGDMRNLISKLYCLIFASTALTVIGGESYQFIKEIPIPNGNEGWDYLSVDSAGHRLYVSHGSRVVVVDIAGIILPAIANADASQQCLRRFSHLRLTFNTEATR